MIERHFSTSQAAEILAMSLQTFRNQRAQGKGPKGFPTGRGHSWLYPEIELERYLGELKEQATKVRHPFEKSVERKSRRDSDDEDTD
jgi:hypothetical protein